MIQSQDFFPFSSEQECRKKLKTMCGYKGRESYFMLTVAIQKEYTIVYFTKFKFLHMQFCNRIYQFF